MLHKDFTGDFSRKIRQATNDMYQKLSAAEAEATAKIKSGGQAMELDKLMKSNPDEFVQRATGQDLGIHVSDQVLNGGPDAIMNYVRSVIRNPLANAKQAEAQLHYIGRVKTLLKEPDGLRRVNELLDVERKQFEGLFGSGIERNFPGLRNLIDEIDEVYKLDASALSDTKFVQHAINLGTDPNNKRTFDLFMSNPGNAQRWIKMKNSTGFVGEMINKMDPRMSLKRRMIGITPKETAKRLGLGAATLGVGYGAVKVYNWFGNNDPNQVGSVATKIQSSSKALTFSGPAKPIMNSVNGSLNKVTVMSNEVNRGLAGEDAAEAAKKYITGVSAEIGVIADGLKQWEVVVNNSSDSAAAVALGNELVQYVKNLSVGIDGLSSQLGSVSIPSGTISETGKAGTTDTNIAKIQEFLNISPSGQLDRETVARLRSIENEFNRRAGTDRFSGAFVVPEAGHVIDYNNLMKAYQKIQKY